MGPQQRKMEIHISLGSSWSIIWNKKHGQSCLRGSVCTRLIFSTFSFHVLEGILHMEDHYFTSWVNLLLGQNHQLWVFPSKKYKTPQANRTERCSLSCFSSCKVGDAWVPGEAGESGTLTDNWPSCVPVECGFQSHVAQCRSNHFLCHRWSTWSRRQRQIWKVRIQKAQPKE